MGFETTEDHHHLTATALDRGQGQEEKRKSSRMTTSSIPSVKAVLSAAAVAAALLSCVSSCGAVVGGVGGGGTSPPCGNNTHDDRHHLHRRLLATATFHCGTKSPTKQERRDMDEAARRWKDREQEEAKRRRASNGTSGNVQQQQQQLSSWSPQQQQQQQQHVIPVHFTVFVPSSGKDLVSPERSKAMIDALNRGFAATSKAKTSSSFAFRHASTVHVVNPAFSRCEDEEEFKRLHRRGGALRKDVLNVYLCDTLAQDLIGFSTLPPAAGATVDGVVLLNPGMFTATAASGIYLTIVDTGLVHETGHWLGLLHTFEDGCSANTYWHRIYDGELYYFQNGDGVPDTPAHSGPTYEQPESKYCWIGQGLDTCDDQSIAGIDKGVDPVDNFMNYLFSRCYSDYGRFTTGQVERMLSQFEQYRKNPKPCSQINQLCDTLADCCEGNLVTGSQSCQVANAVSGQKICLPKVTASPPPTLPPTPLPPPPRPPVTMLMGKKKGMKKKKGKKKACRKRGAPCARTIQCCFFRGRKLKCRSTPKRKKKACRVSRAH